MLLNFHRCVHNIPMYMLHNISEWKSINIEFIDGELIGYPASPTINVNLKFHIHILVV